MKQKNRDPKFSVIFQGVIHTFARWNKVIMKFLLGCLFFSFLEGMTHRLVTLESLVQDRSLFVTTANSHIVYFTEHVTQVPNFKIFLFLPSLIKLLWWL